MPAAQIRLVNIDPRNLPLAVDALIGYKKKISGKIPVGGFIDVSSYGSYDAISTNADIQKLITKGYIKLQVVGGGTEPVAGVEDTVKIGELYEAHYTLPSGGSAGTPDDVLLIQSMPWAARLDNYALISSNAAGTVQLRSLSGGLGVAYSTAVTAASGKVSDTAPTSEITIPAGTAIYARRSDRSEVGEVELHLVRLS